MHVTAEPEQLLSQPPPMPPQRHRQPERIWTKPAVVAAVVASVLGTWTIAKGIGEVTSVPARVKALEEAQKVADERWRQLSGDVKQLTVESSAAARRTEDAQSGIRSSLAEVGGNIRALTVAVSEQNARLIKMEASSSAR